MLHRAGHTTGFQAAWGKKWLSQQTAIPMPNVKPRYHGAQRRNVERCWPRMNFITRTCSNQNQGAIGAEWPLCRPECLSFPCHWYFFISNITGSNAAFVLSCRWPKFLLWPEEKAMLCFTRAFILRLQSPLKTPTNFVSYFFFWEWNLLLTQFADSYSGNSNKEGERRVIFTAKCNTNSRQILLMPKQSQEVKPSISFLFFDSLVWLIGVFCVWEVLFCL